MTIVDQHDIVVSRTVEPLDEEPCDREIANWLTHALVKVERVGLTEVSVQILSRDEMASLNQQYRGRDKPTNVLSFPAETALEDNRILLGDIAVCSDVVLGEAIEYNKTFQSRYAHIMIHGLLHLLGYDHVEKNEQFRMEKMETEILLGIGFDKPYEVGVSA